MTKPSFISTMIKATPALVIGCTLLTSSFHLGQGAAIAQSINPIEDSSFEPANSTNTNLLELTSAQFRRPRNSRSRSRSRTTTATRQDSCLSSADTAFMILGPDSDIGQTSASHPAFVWYLPQSATGYPVTFRLLAPNEAGIPTPIHTAQIDYAAGFVKYQLPTSLPALTAGKEYRWQVVIECNPNYPSQSPSQELSFEVVPSPAELSPALASATTEADRANAYGQSGLWYEAIAQVAEANTATSRATRTGLLQNLSELESENVQFREDIAAIAATTR